MAELPLGLEDHGENLRCAECGARMQLRAGKHGVFYGCVRYPGCDGTHGAHQNTGRPMGKPGTAEERQARREAHAAFDLLWRGKGYMSRAAAYAWLAKAMDLSLDEAHIGLFNAEQCRRAIEACRDYRPKKFMRGQSKSRRFGRTHDNKEARITRERHERKSSRTRRSNGVE